MCYYSVTGGRRLSGEINIHGAKNSVLPILAATVLYGGKSVLHNCPKLRDVIYAEKILEQLGCKVSQNGSDIEVDASNVSSYEIDDALMREMRSSVTFLGAVLARCGKAKMSLPGGCELGPRPIDLHISALRKLGAVIFEEGGKIACDARNMRGTEINLAFPSVGATENIMLAATACKGTTRIINAAREPEIVDLQEFLVKCGAKVRGAGGSVIEIEGCTLNKSPEHTIMPDRIEAATYISACVSAGGNIKLCGADGFHIAPVISLFSDCGVHISRENKSITVSMDGRPKGAGMVRTTPYPGFPTDAQAVVMAAMTRSMGTSIFIETIFENRFRHVSELIRMGADIRVEGRTAIVNGVRSLSGAHVVATDLRGGAALVAAALGADGESRISGLKHIDRGYENFDVNLSALGADIKRFE